MNIIQDDEYKKEEREREECVPINSVTGWYLNNSSRGFLYCCCYCCVWYARKMLLFEWTLYNPLREIHLLSYRICVASIENEACCVNESEIDTHAHAHLEFDAHRTISKSFEIDMRTVLWCVFAAVGLSKMSCFFFMFSICKLSKMSRRRQKSVHYYRYWWHLAWHQNKSLSLNESHKITIHQRNEGPWYMTICRKFDFLFRFFFFLKLLLPDERWNHHDHLPFNSILWLTIYIMKLKVSELIDIDWCHLSTNRTITGGKNRQNLKLANNLCGVFFLSVWSSTNWMMTNQSHRNATHIFDMVKALGGWLWDDAL